jgi:hypothetical protein
MAILWRVWATLAGVILAVLMVFLALSTFQFSRVHSSLVGERLVVLADQSAAPFEAAARLGLPVSDVRNATGILERVRQTDDRITAIYVFDDAGKIVHATGAGSVDALSVTAIRARATGDREWYGEVESGFVAGVNFAGPTAKMAGGIAILYPRSASTTRVWAMAAELSVAAFGILLVSALAAGLLLRVGLGRTIASFDRLDGEIAEFERDSWRGIETLEEPTGLRAELDAAFERYREAVAEIRRHGLDRGQ